MAMRRTFSQARFWSMRIHSDWVNLRNVGVGLRPMQKKKINKKNLAKLRVASSTFLSPHLPESVTRTMCLLSMTERSTTPVATSHAAVQRCTSGASRTSRQYHTDPPQYRPVRLLAPATNPPPAGEENALLFLVIRFD